MTRRSTRIAWGLLGICLFIGAAASLVVWLGPQDKGTRDALRELSALADMLALVFWMLVFGLYWNNRNKSDSGDGKF